MAGAAGPHEREAADAALVDEAARRIGAKDLAGAEAILRDVVSRTPPGYASETVEGDRLVARYWTSAEFVFACFRREEELKRRKLALTWLPNAYARARGHLAFIHVERGALAEAVAELDRGLALDPGHPHLLLEKALALVHLERPDEGAQIAVSVAARDDVLPADRARAMRSAGNAFVATGHLDGAEMAYRKSLELDPDNALARNELLYIAHLRKGGAPVEGSATPVTDVVDMVCADCLLPLSGPGVAFVDARGIRYRCAACERRRTKRWWQFWK